MFPTEKIARKFIRLAFKFETLLPFLMRLGLTLFLMKQKRNATITDYRIAARRLGKYFYEVRLKVTLNSRQARDLVIKNLNLHTVMELVGLLEERRK